jgi:hypothetical protein
MGENRNAYRILVGKSEGHRPLERPRSRWLNNNRMDLRGIEWDGVDWIDMAQNRDQWRALVNRVLNFRFHKMLEVLEWLHNWRFVRKGSAP